MGPHGKRLPTANVHRTPRRPRTQGTRAFRHQGQPHRPLAHRPVPTDLRMDSEYAVFHNRGRLQQPFRRYGRGNQLIQPRQGHRPSPPFGAKGQRLHHRQGHTGHHRTGRLARGHRSGLSVRRCGGRRDRQRRHRNATGAGHRSRRRRQRREGNHHDHRKPRHPGRNHKRQQPRSI